MREVGKFNYSLGPFSDCLMPKEHITYQPQTPPPSPPQTVAYVTINK